jgi:HNH endonuclease
MSLRIPGSVYREFIEGIEFTEGCWNWIGSKPSKRGYCRFSLSSKKRDYVHRIAYLFFVGGIRAGHQVHHLCENKRCVNPDHLCQVSREEHRRIHGLWEGDVRVCPYCELDIAGDNAWYTNDRKLPRCRNCQRERGRKSDQRLSRKLRRIG